MFSTWFGGDKDKKDEEPAGVFHEYPHPANWRETVDELYARFGADGEQIPVDMCPCGGRKATVRRFLVARKYKVDEAEKMLRDTIVWRQTVSVGNVKGVDNILKAKPRWDLLGDNRKIIPSTPFHCYSKQGFPVYIVRLGKGDGALATTAPEDCHVYCSLIRGEHLTKVIVPEAQKRYKANGGMKGMLKGKEEEAAGGAAGVAAAVAAVAAVGVAEAAADGGAPNGKKKEVAAEDDALDVMDKQVVVVDLEGIGMSALRCLYVFKVINSVAAYNYPELSKAIYILNSPSVFDYIWSAVKPLLAAHTQSKIRIFSTGPDQYKALQRILDDDDIPDYLTPQVEGQAVKGRVGCVTDFAAGCRPKGVKEMDVWIESLSEDPDKRNPD
eukprot:CAMPEP_0197613648 /NCGR_PEP_ID=MMETSP1326-20131121/59126_1 /TAXON_ID=1155430 /ORGANISM="Genus nov. species nov., Strain RCC2288" /LENGTH=383 /DNA_ID=CAMNT_0043182511 /DNA_START=417 /DNA_END=1568 /DNA_ORIENTATION=-